MKRLADTFAFSRFAALRAGEQAVSVHSLFYLTPRSCEYPPRVRPGGSFLFGGGDCAVSVASSLWADTARAADLEFSEMRRRNQKAKIDKERVRAWKKDRAFMEMALSVAFNSVPVFRGGGNALFHSGTWARVRAVRETGDCFVDIWAGSRWKSRRFDALQYLAEALSSDFGGMLAFCEMLEEQMRKRGIVLRHAPPAARRFSRLALLKLKAKHRGLQWITREGMALVWLAARRRRFADTEELARELLRVCGGDLSEKARRRARYFLARLPKAVVHSFFQLSETSDYRDFANWLAEFQKAIAAAGGMAQLRCLLFLWWRCLSREGGGWRWQGFHRHWEHGGRRGVAAQLAKSVGVSKSAARAAIAVGSLLGFIVVAGRAVCLSVGNWGKILIRTLATAANESSPAMRNFAGRILRILAPPVLGAG